MPVPAKPDEVTAGWLAAAFGMSPAQLSGFSVEPLGEGRGILALLARARLEWAAGLELPSTVVAKFDPAARETRFFRELAVDCGVATPAVYFSEVDRETGACALLMEDLGSCRMYASGEAPVEVVADLARAAARLHARWWASPVLKSLTWLNSPEARTKRFPAVLRAALPGARPWIEANAPSEILALVERMPAAIERGLYLGQGSRTLVHGDLGPRNVAIRTTNEVVFFDWQLCAADSPGWELAQLVQDAYGPLSVGETVDLVFGAYYDALREAGVYDLSMAELGSTFALGCTRGLTTPVGILRPGETDEAREQICRRWISVVTAMMSRFDFEAIIDHGLRG